MILRLPEAPALNRYYRNFRGRMVMSAEGRAYKQAVALYALQAQCPTIARECPVRVQIDWHRARASGDLDGRFKTILDALQGICYVDDAQIVELNAKRYENKDDPHMQVVVEVAEWAVAIAGSARPPRKRRSSRRVRVRAA